MACNCSVNKQIDELYARFSNKNDTKKLNTSSKIGLFLEKSFACMILLAAIPLLALYMTNEYRIGNNQISFVKFFEIKNVKQ